MRIKRTLISIVVGCLAIATLSVALAVAEEKATVVPLAKVPPAVQKTIQATLAGAKLGEIERIDDDGEVTFDVEMSRGDTERIFSVAENGTLLSVEVFLAETPFAVQKTIKSVVGDGELDGIDRAFEGTNVTFEVEMTTKAGADRSFTVAPDGKLISVQVGLEETPAAVRKTIEAKVAGGKLGDVFRTVDEGKVSFDVDATIKGKQRDFTVAENGKLESYQVFLSETPPAAHKTIKNRIGDGKVIRIDKVFNEKDDFVFEIEGRKGGKDFDFSVGAKGKFLGMDD